jgi:hypothetical protein
LVVAIGVGVALSFVLRAFRLWRQSKN